MTEASTGSELWSYAVALYESPGITDACLLLQNDYGFNVPVLLTCFFATERGVDDTRLVPSCLDATGEWHAAVVAPLRSARGALKRPISGFDIDAQQSLRRQVSGLEIEAERMHLNVLEAVVASFETADRESPGSRVARLGDHVRAWPQLPPLDGRAIDALATILGAAVGEIDGPTARSMLNAVLV